MLYTGGYNAHGQLALGDTESRPLLSLVLFDYQVKQVAQGSYFTLILTDHNEVFLAGRDTYHNSVKTFRKIRFDFINNRVTNIYCGASHSILVTSTNSLYIFGDNTEGQLCVGQDTTALEDPVMIMLPSPDRIKFIATHLSYATYLVTEKDELFVSGGNSDGQLGLGHIDPVHTLERVDLEGALKGQQQIIAMTCGVYCSALLIGKKTWDKDAKVKALSALSGFHDVEFEYVIEPNTPTK
jgi:alpha-tubulin suppressor-like RCC1 family protein